MISGAASAWHRRPTMDGERGDGDPPQDEFDVYFARAAAAAAFIASSSSPSPFQSPFPSSSSTYAADRCLIPPVKDVVDYGRHDSLPDIEISLLLDDDGPGGVQPRSPARTSSCRYPHRRNPIDRRKVSPSPSSSFPSSCAAPPPAVSKDALKPAVGAVVASSSCLRAPSPRHEELRCHSAPHSRSSSWKKMKRPVSFRDLKEVQQLEDEEEEESQKRRRRGGSQGGVISLEDAISAKLQELKLLQADDCYVVRQFSTSSKGIVNRGDSIKRRASSTSCSSTTSISPICPLATTASPSVSSLLVASVSAPEMPSVAIAAGAVSLSLISARRTSGRSTSGEGVLSPEEEAERTPDGRVHVLVLGDEGVGKTSLLQQFMTSEYMAAVQTSFDDECEKTLSVLLDGEETLLEFLESNSMTAIQDCRQRSTDIEVYIFVYSLTARDSFKFIVDQLHELRENSVTQSKPGIVVANKTDLVRTRQVTEEEGREISRSMDSGYWEVSTVLNHQLDELLVGIVTLLRSRGETNGGLQGGRGGGEGGGGGVVNGRRASIGHHLRYYGTAEGGDRRRGSESDDDHSGGVRHERNCVRSATELIRGFFRRQKDVSKSCEYLL